MLDTGAQRLLARVSVFPRGEGLESAARAAALSRPGRPSAAARARRVDHDPEDPGRRPPHVWRSCRRASRLRATPPPRRATPTAAAPRPRARPRRARGGACDRASDVSSPAAATRPLPRRPPRRAPAAALRGTRPPSSAARSLAARSDATSSPVLLFDLHRLSRTSRMRSPVSRATTPLGHARSAEFRRVAARPSAHRLAPASLAACTRGRGTRNRRFERALPSCSEVAATRVPRARRVAWEAA